MFQVIQAAPVIDPTGPDVRDAHCHVLPGSRDALEGVSERVSLALDDVGESYGCPVESGQAGLTRSLVTAMPALPEWPAEQQEL